MMPLLMICSRWCVVGVTLCLFFAQTFSLPSFLEEKKSTLFVARSRARALNQHVQLPIYQPCTATQLFHHAVDSLYFSGQLPLSEQKDDHSRGAKSRSTSAFSSRGKSLQRDSSFVSSNDLHLAWVRHSSSGLIPSIEIANAVATDRRGNVVVTGLGTATFSEGNFLTMKYDHDGKQLWIARGSNLEGEMSEARAVAIDTAGNIIVTGVIQRSYTNHDILTIKYDSNGVELWRSIYNGVADSDDVPIAIALDPAGNAYITGYSYGEDYDYITLKYSLGGAEEWSQRYNGTGNNADIATGIVVKGDYVTITGTTTGSTLHADAGTIRYTTSGMLQWIALYSTSGSNYGNALTVDPSGNTYLVGTTQNTGIASDCLLLKYGTNGEEKWVTTYDGPAGQNDVGAGFALGRNGEGYFVGSTENSIRNQDFITERIDLQTGAVQWARRYDNPGHGKDIAIGVLFSFESNVFVSGYSQYNSGSDFDFLTIKYDTTGTPLADARYNGAGKDDIASSMAVDSIGNLYVTGTSEASSSDIAIVQYKANVSKGWQDVFADGNNKSDANSIVTDNGGNSYLAGYSGGNILLMKHNSTGERVWIKLFPDIHGSATALKLDPRGYLYIAGFAVDSSTLRHSFLTVKLDTNGVLLWKKFYHGTATGDDEVAGLAIDTSGNVYVTGKSADTLSMYDITTIKYDPAGNALWIDIYNGDLDFDDVPSGIAVTPQQNVVIAGTTIQPDSSKNFVTIEFSPQGNYRWMKFGNGARNGVDRANAVCVDSSGNVIVTGASLGLGSGIDWLTIKYSSTGVELWRAEFSRLSAETDEPVAIVADKRGRIYVTGVSYSSFSSLDYCTIQYSPTGSVLWKIFYDGPAHANDIPAGIQLDNGGNVLVTGTSYTLGTYTDIVTVKYSGAGKEVAVDRYNSYAGFNDAAHGMTIDAGGDILIAGNTTDGNGVQRALLLKTGQPTEDIWPVRYDGPGLTWDQAVDMGIDSSGSIYLTQQRIQSNFIPSVSTMKYDASGTELWNTTFDAWYGTPHAIAVDRNGSVFITGGTFTFQNTTNYLSLKYNPDGVEQWFQIYNGNGNVYSPIAIGVDHSSSVYVVGNARDPISNDDVVTLKYSFDGNSEWIRRFNGSLNNPDDNVFGMQISTNGNVYITGLSASERNRGDYITLKYLPDGSQSWVSYYDGPSRMNDHPNAITLDRYENVYVTGLSVGLDTSYDYLTVKYDSQGTEQWTARYGRPGNNDDNALSLAIDSSGNVYVTGISSPVPYVSYDIVTVKYNSQGVEQWVQRFDGEGHDDDRAKMILIDRTGHIIVGGQTTASDGVTESILLEYDTLGVLRCQGRYRSPGSSANQIKKISLDESGNIYALVASASTSWSVSTVLKYVRYELSVLPQKESSGVRSFALLSGYPNPFNPVTSLEIFLTAPAFVSLRVYDILGNEVATPVSHERLPSGNFKKILDGSQLASGIYFARMTAELVYSHNGKPAGYVLTSTMKLVLLR